MMWRVRLVEGSVIVALILVILRLFYWQIVVSEKLVIAAENQHFTTTEIPELL